MVLRGLLLFRSDGDEESPGQLWQLPVPGVSPPRQPQGAKIPPFCKISRCWCLLEGGGVAELLPLVCSPQLFVAQKKGEINNNFLKRDRELLALRFFLNRRQFPGVNEKRQWGEGRCWFSVSAASEGGGLSQCRRWPGLSSLCLHQVQASPWAPLFGGYWAFFLSAFKENVSACWKS